MNNIELLKNFAQSLDGYQISPPVAAPEQITVLGEVKISCQVEKSRQDDKPAQGAAFTLFKPKALNNELKRRKVEAAKSPLKVVQSLAPEWLKRPVLKGEKTARTDILAFRKATEKIVDRIETASCRKCRGAGSVEVRRTESTSVPCSSCGGLGSRSVTTYIHAPGTTAHGAPRSELRTCASCWGNGNVSGPSKVYKETQTCGNCNGSGNVQKTIYKKQEFYETFRAATILAVTGKERPSKTITRLRKYAPGDKISLPGLLKICPKPEIGAKEKAGKILLSITISVPFSAYDVLHNEKKIGAVYTIPEDGSALSVASSAVFDRGLKRKITQIGRLRPEEIDAAKSKDFVLAELVIAVQSKRTKLVEDAISWSVSPAVFKKAIKTTRQSMRKGGSLLSRIGLR